ncbi:hypothetical protein [Aquisphaera insulae]|uniref:hypothetical protein n=1 Tax=Aquisphaera insulae TaxID=2712864 RepID=UPI0013ED9624|nr:hypothetical protein [Aquisphaera insulae]
MRWIGIDEAGYGPNLGPLVMTAVIAESVEGTASTGRRAGEMDEPPDLWAELHGSVARAGGDSARLWVDDSKAILRGGKGRDSLTATCLALLRAVGRALPEDPRGLFEAVHAGTPAEVELATWAGADGGHGGWPAGCGPSEVRTRIGSDPLAPASGRWRFVEVRTVVFGPERFNRLLDLHESKAAVHFQAFRHLLEDAWQHARGGRPALLDCDKHGGRHYYLEPLCRAFPETWIDRGEEGPELSEYTLRGDGRVLRLRLRPRADARNGLVALASIVSKCLREVWMDAFNGYWTARVAGLRPTAGYPVDAARFRAAIDPLARELGHLPETWWRRK